MRYWNSPIPDYKIVEFKRQGYIVYSVGRNQKDDGGSVDDDKDIVFMVMQ